MALVTTAADNARKLTTYAKFNNNTTLQSEVNISESSFKNFSDSDLKDYAQIIYDCAQANVASLSNYGITAAIQTTFATAITNYNALLATPRINATAKSQATKQLVTLFNTDNAALDNMDTAVEIIRLSQVIFYNGYKTARKIISTGVSSFALNGTATELQNGEPVENATFTFQTTVPALLKAAATSGNVNSNGNEKIVKKIAAKGKFNIKSMPEGTYTVTITKPGYKDQVVTTNVVNGELTNLFVQLEKA